MLYSAVATAKKAPREYYFPDTEAPTRKTGLEHEVAVLAKAYRDMSVPDRLFIMRLIELKAYGKPDV